MNNKYLKQLIFGCDKGCLGIFCGFGKAEEDQSVFILISEHLKDFNDIFLCKNLDNKLMKFRNANRILQETQKKGKNIEFPLIKSDHESVVDQNENIINKILNFLLLIIDMSNNHRKYIDCSFKNLSEFRSDKLSVNIVLCNVLKVLLYKYNQNREDFLGLITLRMFMIVDFKYFQLSLEFQSILNTLISDISAKYASKFQSQYSEYDFSLESLNTQSFTIKDFVNFVKNFIDFLDHHTMPYIRTHDVVEDLLNNLTIMYVFNEHVKIFQYKSFYLNRMCKLLNLKEEYRCYKEHSKSILNYSFVLPLEFKTEILRYENSDIMKSSLQDAFFRSLYEGPLEPYLFVHVNRDKIFTDLRKSLNISDPKNLEKQLKVSFEGEEGVDNGGIRKEFFQLLSEYFLEESNLFLIKNNLVWINPVNKDYKSFKYFGMILGMALYNDVILNLPFPKLFFKKLLNKKIELEDLSEIEPVIFKSLLSLQNASPKELEDADLTFEITYELKDGSYENISLLKNPRTIVSSSNIDIFIYKYVSFLCKKSVFKQFSAIKKGFHQIIPPNRIQFLHHEELEKIIVGSSYININELRNNAILTNYKATDPVIQHFWEIFEDYSAVDQKKLLQFITGNERIPILDLNSFRLTILRNGCDTDRLPSSQTCFNTLLLPEYSSKEKMKEKIDKAISMTKGFYLL